MKEEVVAYKSLYQADSPILSAPQSIQDYFRSLKSVEEHLPELKHEFEPKPSPTYICTKILKAEDKYYYCEQCAINQQIDTMIFCETCFDRKLHEGHTFTEKVAGKNQCSCDCGRKLRIKQSCFCSVHADKNRQLDIKEQDAQKFNQFFLSLFRILLFLERKKQQKLKPLVELIFKNLSALCQQSLYYSRLTSGILKKTVNMGESEQQIGSKMLNYDQFGGLLLLLAGDREFLLDFGETFMEIQQKGTILLFQFNGFRRQLLDSEQFLVKMAKKGIYFPSELNNYFTIASSFNSEEDKINFITNFLTKIASKLEPAEYVDLVCSVIKQDGCIVLKNQNFLNEILTNVLSNFVGKEDAEEKKEGDEEKKFTNQEKLALKKSMSVVNRIILQKCQENITAYESTLQKAILNHQKLRNSFNNLLEKFIEADLFKQLIKEVLRPIMALVLFALDKHPKKSDLLLKVWNSIILTSKPFNDNLDNIYEIVGFLANSYRTFSILGGNEEQFSKLEEKELKQKLFKSYLFETKEVSKKDLWSQFNQGWLNFSKCGKILNELCEYQDNTDTFIYKSKLSYPNPLLKIPLEISRNWENVRKIDVNYQWPSLCESVTLKKMILTLFKGEEFYNIFQESFIRSLQTIEKQPRTLERWKNRGIGQNYIIILLLITKLCNSQENILIQQELMRIKYNTEEYRFRFSQIGNEQRIKKMLCADPPVQNLPQQVIAEKKEQKNQQQLMKEEMKRKMNEKKAIIENRLRQKQKNTIQKIKNEKSSVIEEEEQNYCLSCKQRQRVDNQFVTLICLGRGNTISKILHAEQSKTNVKISTNLHTIHLNCFKEMKKKNMQFNCPLCKENINCFLPYRPNRASSLTLEICWNVFNAVLVSCYNFYETGSLFDVLLDALVESLGFTELVSAKKSKNIIKLKNKSDLHLIEMLTCLYSFGSASEKQKYRSVYNALKEKIKTCTRKQIQLFQLVILDAIFSRISGEIDLQTTLVENLSKYMIEDELKILKNTLMFITDGNGDALSSLDDLSLSRIEEESPTKKSEKIEEELTSLENLDEPCKNEQIGTPIKQIIYERRSLGINITTPPKKLAHLFSKNYLKQCGNNGKCQCQSQQVSQICLVCRKIFCEKCEDDKFHSEMHLSNYISLDLGEGRLVIHKAAKEDRHDIYYNDFMIEFKKTKQDDEQNSDPEDGQEFVLFKPKKIKQKKDNKQALYSLNLNKFNNLVEKFYNLAG